MQVSPPNRWSIFRQAAVGAAVGTAVSALLAAAVAFAPSHSHAAETTLTKATDLQVDAAAARKAGVPILVLYSLPGCPYCEAIRRSHLAPLAAEVPAKAIIRQIDLQSVAVLRGFDGKPTTHAEFVRARGIKFAPVVSFFGSDGQPIGESLVGTMLPDFYGAYLADALSTATAKVRASPTAQR
jgi:thiol-disulfide isomerase/thioredoxin